MGCYYLGGGSVDGSEHYANITDNLGYYYVQLTSASLYTSYCVRCVKD